jgi:hypothetical protein
MSARRDREQNPCTPQDSSVLNDSVSTVTEAPSCAASRLLTKAHPEGVSLNADAAETERWPTRCQREGSVWLEHLLFAVRHVFRRWHGESSPTDFLWVLANRGPFQAVL